MARKKFKPNILPANKDERSSRFVVDLASSSQQSFFQEGGQARQAVREKEEEKQVEVNQVFEKAMEYNFRKFWPKYMSRFKSSIKSSILWLKKLIHLFLINRESGFIAAKEIASSPPASRRTPRNDSKWHNGQEPQFGLVKKWYENYREKLEELAFFGLFKFVILLAIKIIKLFYKLCYGVGWLFIFFVRLVGLVLEKSTTQMTRIFTQMTRIVNTRIKIMGGYIIGVGKSLKQRVVVIITGLLRLPMLASLNRSPRNDNDDYEELLVEKESYSRRVVFKPVLGFALILFILILPFKAFTYYKSLDVGGLESKVLGATDSAISGFMEATQSAGQLDFNQASQNFQEAGNNFLKVEEELGNINQVLFSLASLVPSGKIRLAAESKNILAAGQIASSLGSNLSLAFKSLFASQDNDLLKIIDNFVIYGKQAAKDAESLNLQLNLIDGKILPSDYEKQFMSLKEKVGELEQGLTEFVKLVDNLKIFLGASEDKRYLLVFQNNTELRATGGFIGSFAIVDFKEGKIKNLEVPGGGSYDTEGGMRELVAAPEPLSLVNPLWHFWDANWWPDWRVSAKKLMWFYERSDGSTVDGVISFTPTVLERLLEIIGPVDMTEKYGVILTAENFWIETQMIAEEKLTPEQIQAGEKHEPKKIIGDLMNKIIEELPAHLNKDSLIKLLSIIKDSLSEKQALFYFTDKGLQGEIEKLGWDGSIKDTNWDYLSVINTNIAGGKSDKRIEEEINEVVEVMPNGSIINTVKIIRTHTGVKREPFCGVRNVNWMRIYVPAGSELLEVQGFKKPDEIYFEKADISWQKDPMVFQAETTAQIHEPSGTKIYQESKKTVFANWSMVDPGESVTIYLKYKLPFNSLKKDAEDYGLLNKIKSLINPTQKDLYPYAMLLQKQSGAMASKINISLKLPANFKIAWRYPKDLSTTHDGWQISDELDIDKYWAVLLEMDN